MDSTAEDPLELITIPSSACPDPIYSMVYIDDYNTIEKLCLEGAQSHITVNRRELKLLAAKSELQFKNVQRLANHIKMVVNSKKTQFCVFTQASIVI